MGLLEYCHNEITASAEECSGNLDSTVQRSGVATFGLHHRELSPRGYHAGTEVNRETLHNCTSLQAQSYHLCAEKPRGKLQDKNTTAKVNTVPHTVAARRNCPV